LGLTARQNPAYDLIQTDEEIFVTTDLPGIKREDIAITFSGSNLIIKEELKSVIEDRDNSLSHIEKKHGSFNRVIHLPVPVDTSEVKRNFNKGILEIRLTKCYNSEYFIG